MKDDEWLAEIHVKALVAGSKPMGVTAVRLHTATLKEKQMSRVYVLAAVVVTVGIMVSIAVPSKIKFDRLKAHQRAIECVSESRSKLRIELRGIPDLQGVLLEWPLQDCKKEIEADRNWKASEGD